MTDARGTSNFFPRTAKKSDRPPKIFNHPHRPPLEVNWVVLQPWERIVSHLYFISSYIVVFFYRTTVLIFNTCDGVADYMRVAAKHGVTICFFTNRPV